MLEQSGEQCDVAIGPDRQMQVGDVRRHRAARIDEHDLHLGPLVFGGGDALIENGMAPGEVGADEHDEIGKFEILVASRHGVGAEGAPVAGDGRRHAQPRIGIDVGRADEALHQLVGDVVVLGQQLTGDIEGDRVGSVLGDGLRECRSDEVERVVPARGPRRATSGKSSRSSRPIVSASADAFGAEPAEIRRMVGVAADGNVARRRATSASTPQPTPQ